MALQKEKTIGVRFDWPEDVHKTMRTYQKQISLQKEKEFTFEEAVIEFIREYKAKKLQAA